jgi:hypothetical protein
MAEILEKVKIEEKEPFFGPKEKKLLFAFQNLFLVLSKNIKL